MNNLDAFSTKKFVSCQLKCIHVRPDFLVSKSFTCESLVLVSSIFLQNIFEGLHVELVFEKNRPTYNGSST